MVEWLLGGESNSRFLKSRARRHYRKQSELMQNSDIIESRSNPYKPIEHAEQRVYKIGDLAREFDVTLRTLRFYEDRGLINPGRSGTTRLYSSEDRERLRVALFCKRIGLSLGDIRQVLDLHEQNDRDATTTNRIRQVYLSQLSALELQQQETMETIADLKGKLAEMDNQS